MRAGFNHPGGDFWQERKVGPHHHRVGADALAQGAYVRHGLDQPIEAASLLAQRVMKLCCVSMHRDDEQ